MAIERQVIIVTRDTNQDLHESTISGVNATLPGASLTAAVDALRALSTDTYVTAYVIDKQYINDIA